MAAVDITPDATRPPGTAPTTAELVARARALRPLLAANASQGEADRRVVEESIQALIGAGLFKIAVPRRYGGYETSVRTMLEVSAAVGEADGGTAWVLTLVNVCNWLIGLFPQQAQDDVFGADPGALVSGVLAPTATTVKVEGGWRVTGKWYYNSGSWHATWAGLGIPVTDADGAVVNQGLALIPRGDLGLEDTWFVAGMKSTGSNCLVADDVFVPEHRVMLVPPAIVGEYPSEHLGERAVLPLRARARAGPRAGWPAARHGPGGARLRDQQGREEAGLLHVLHRAGRVRRLPAAGRGGGAAASTPRGCTPSAPPTTSTGRPPDGEYPDLLTRARVRSDTGYVAECVTRAIDILLYAHGAAAFADVSPLQRIWRDSATAARHAVVSPQVSYEVYGKALLGVEDNITPLI